MKDKGVIMYIIIVIMIMIDLCDQLITENDPQIDNQNHIKNFWKLPKTIIYKNLTTTQ